MSTQDGEAEPFDGFQDYLVDRSAQWYHPVWCHGGDHHEYLHAMLARKKKELSDAYAALANSGPQIQLAMAMAEQHRPVRKWDPLAYLEQYLVQCAACDRNVWRIWREGDPDTECELWRRAVALRLVTP